MLSPHQHTCFSRVPASPTQTDTTSFGTGQIGEHTLRIGQGFGDACSGTSVT